MKKAVFVLMVLCCVALAACGGQLTQSSSDATSDGAAGVWLASADEQGGESGDIAVASDLAWRCKDEEVIAEDVAKGTEVAKLSLADLVNEGERVRWQSIASWDTSQVMLCLYVQPEEEQAQADGRVLLATLSLEDGAIVARDNSDKTSSLGKLLSAKESWIELNMISAGERLVFAALDADFQVHFFAYDPKTDDLTEKGTRPLSQFRSMVPYGDDVLIVEPDAEDESHLTLGVLSLASGEAKTVATILVDSALDTFNYAYGQADNLLYYSANSLVYAAKVADGEAAQPVGRLDEQCSSARCGALVADRYVCHDAKGNLASCDAHGKLDITKLSIADTVGVEAMSDYTSDFALAQADYVATTRTMDEDASLAEQLGSDSARYDAYIVRLGTDEWDQLVSEGRVAGLGQSEVLRAAADDMPDQVRAAAQKDGELLAVPIATESPCILLNVSALQEVAGLTKDQIPTDWAGFLELMAKIANEGTLQNSEYTLFDGGVGREQLREILLQNIMQDYYLLKTKGGEGAKDAQASLVAVLEAFNKVDWTRLGLSDDTQSGQDTQESDDTNVSGDSKEGQDMSADMGEFYESGSSESAIMSEAALSPEVMDVAEGVMFWPLSIKPGGERLIPQTVMALCVNPQGANLAGATSFAEYVWEHLDGVAKVAVSKSANDPVKNEQYEEDLAYQESVVAELEQAVKDQTDPSQAEEQKAQLEDAKAYAQRYKQNAQWAASEQSIATYRSFEKNMVCTGGMALDDVSMAEAMFGYLDGESSPESYAKALDESLA